VGERPYFRVLLDLRLQSVQLKGVGARDSVKIYRGGIDFVGVKLSVMVGNLARGKP